MATYYTVTKTFTANTLAVGGDVLFECDAIAAAFEGVNSAIVGVQGEISEYHTDASVGFGASLDLRWIWTTTGTNAYSTTPPGAVAALDTITTGMTAVVEFATTNTSTTCTLDIGSSEGAVSLKVEDSAGAMQDPAIGYLSTVRDVVYDGTQWVVSDSRLVAAGLTYTAISAATVLSTGKRYLDTSTAGVSHTLPLLSTTTAGQQIRVNSGADGVKIVKQIAADNSGAPLTVLFLDGDYVEFTSTSTAWVKNAEKFTGRVRVFQTADETIAASTNAKVFSAGYSVDEDTTGGYDTVTNDRYDLNSNWPDAKCNINIRKVSSSDKHISGWPKVSGTDVAAYKDPRSFVGIQTGHFPNVVITAGQYIEVFARNNNTANTNEWAGDAAKDESAWFIDITDWDT